MVVLHRCSILGSEHLLFESPTSYSFINFSNGAEITLRECVVENITFSSASLNCASFLTTNSEGSIFISDCQFRWINSSQKGVILEASSSSLVFLFVRITNVSISEIYVENAGNGGIILIENSNQGL
jgi:hypothetical protein